MRATSGQTQPNAAHRGDSIDHCIKTILKWIDPTFFIEHRVAMESGGGSLTGRRVGKHVAGDLLNRELIERHVTIEGLNHPITIRPDVTILVGLVAVAIGIAGCIKPGARPASPVAR